MPSLWLCGQGFHSFHCRVRRDLLPQLQLPTGRGHSPTPSKLCAEHRRTHSMPGCVGRWRATLPCRSALLMRLYAQTVEFVSGRLQDSDRPACLRWFLKFSFVVKALQISFGDPAVKSSLNPSVPTSRDAVETILCRSWCECLSLDATGPSDVRRDHSCNDMCYVGRVNGRTGSLWSQKRQKAHRQGTHLALLHREFADVFCEAGLRCCLVSTRQYRRICAAWEWFRGASDNDGP